MREKVDAMDENIMLTLRQGAAGTGNAPKRPDADALSMDSADFYCRVNTT